MDISTVVVDERILAVEQELLKLPQVPLIPVHHFARGMYCRELFIPKDTLLTGRIHKHEHIIILFSGEMTLWVGEETIRVRAPYFGVSPPGTKRMGFAHEDTVGMNIIATDCTDPDQVEDVLTCSTYEDYIQFLQLEGKEVPCLEQVPQQ